jgi:hypothetical protein
LDSVLISPEWLTEATLLATATTLLSSTSTLLATATTTSITTATVAAATALLLAPAAAALLLLLRTALSTSLRLFHWFVVDELERFVFLGLFKVEDGCSRSRFAVMFCSREEAND